jgi:hypothetical protein
MHLDDDSSLESKQARLESLGGKGTARSLIVTESLRAQKRGEKRDNRFRTPGSTCFAFCGSTTPAGSKQARFRKILGIL